MNLNRRNEVVIDCCPDRMEPITHERKFIERIKKYVISLPSEQKDRESATTCGNADDTYEYAYDNALVDVRITLEKIIAEFGF